MSVSIPTSTSTTLHASQFRFAKKKGITARRKKTKRRKKLTRKNDDFIRKNKNDSLKQIKIDVFISENFAK